MEEPQKINSFEELLALASQEQRERLCADLEWTEKTCYHISTIISAFAIGILDSYPYYRGFQMPPNFEKVMNYMALKLEEEFAEYDVKGLLPTVNLIKLKGVYKRLAMGCPEYVEWNSINVSPDENVRFSTVYDGVGNEPEFIDIEVPPHNACLYLRAKTRENKAFDKIFEKTHGKNILEKGE